MIVVLQGLMSSEGGTSAGGVTDLELAKICQQSHVSVMGQNRQWQSQHDVTCDTGQGLVV